MTKILIDTDPGHDDAVAILYAAKHLDLVGITTVHGNNTVENTTRNALSVLALAGLDVPVAAGCAAPLVQPRLPFADMHGKTGLDGADLPAPAAAPVAPHAVDFMIEQAAKHRGELVLAIIGPQTNVALALRREPRLASWLKGITIMGGSTTIGNITPAAEFNVYADPEAASVVFGCGAPIHMVGYNVTRVTGFNSGDVARLKGAGRRTAAAIGDLMAFYLRRQDETFGLDVAPMHDVCSIFAWTNPGRLTWREAHVAVELEGRHTRGMTVCDLRNLRRDGSVSIGAPPKPNAKVAVACDARSLIDDVISTLLTYR